jgi:hypothetical protein
MHHGVTELDLGDDDDGLTDNSFEDNSIPDDVHGLAKLRVLNLSGLDCLTGKYKAQYFRYAAPFSMRAIICLSSGSIPDCFGLFHKLEVFEVKGTKLTGTHTRYTEQLHG